MKSILALTIVLLGVVAIQAEPVRLYRSGEDVPDVDVLVLEPYPLQGVFDAEEDDEWRQEQPYTEGAMGKRSIALGRSGFRPGKRSVTGFNSLDVSDLMMKRSMAMGRLGLRPGKRSMAYGRQGFRPGKRSMAYGRQGFRPGKRSMAYGRQGFRPGKRSTDTMEAFPQQVPEIYII